MSATDIEDVERRVAKVIAARDDHEYAHVLLDELWEDVLMAVASGGLSEYVMARMAEAALKPVSRIERWYA